MVVKIYHPHTGLFLPDVLMEIGLLYAQYDMQLTEASETQYINIYLKNNNIQI